MYESGLSYNFIYRIKTINYCNSSSLCLCEFATLAYKVQSGGVNCNDIRIVSQAEAV